MKKILLLLGLLALPLAAFAITGDSARFDFSNGQPTTVDDTTVTCNNQATIRYDFSSGQPTGVFDTTATCTATGIEAIIEPGTVILTAGSLIITGGILIVL